MQLLNKNNCMAGRDETRLKLSLTCSRTYLLTRSLTLVRRGLSCLRDDLDVVLIRGVVPDVAAVDDDVVVVVREIRKSG